MAPVINNTSQDRPGEHLRKLPKLYERAAQGGVSLTQFLEDNDPSREWEGEDRAIGAFGRVLQASGFRFRSALAEGIYADTLEKVYSSDEGRALLPEWTRTIWRRVRATGWAPQVSPRQAAAQHRILESQQEALGAMLRPYADAPGVYNVDLEPGIRLSDVIAFETAINGDAYRRTYLDDPTAADVRLLRIAETADIPRATIRTSQNLIRLVKYGRGIEISYEANRRTPIDKIGMFVAQAALQVEADRVSQAIDVVINGDGNVNTSATNYNQSTLDTGTTPTVKGFLAWKGKWAPPYGLTHIFAREAELLNLQMLQMPNQNPMLLQITGAAGFGSLVPLQDRFGSSIFFGQTDAVASQRT